jgi:hypothetical protein
LFNSGLLVNTVLNRLIPRKAGNYLIIGGNISFSRNLHGIGFDGDNAVQM